MTNASRDVMADVIVYAISLWTKASIITRIQLKAFTFIASNAIAGGRSIIILQLYAPYDLCAPILNSSPFRTRFTHNPIANLTPNAAAKRACMNVN